MFTRRVVFRLRADSSAEFTRIVEGAVFPMRMAREVDSYSEDNAETARFEADDVGLPESPAYSNFTKNLWRTHTLHGLVQSPDR